MIPITNAVACLQVAQSGCSAYDCEFVALAQYLDVPLVSADRKLRKRFGKRVKLLT